MNNITLVGRLTKDPVLTYTQNNKPFAKFVLAVNRQFKNQQTGKYDADFLPVTIWGNSAETAEKYLKKGSQISLAGRVETFSYQKNGQTEYGWGVVSDHFNFVGSSSQNSSAGNTSQSNNNGNFNQSGQSNQGNFPPNDEQFFSGGDAPIDIPDDDLPF
ncbi:MAG: single-stranded DNA-binding protein [Streptococcaceae bacterium]|jgi:single-strand DNA-binding protein|nr:single-stranded DNA-binding protein [Streptococcaceae bacterium]